MDDEFLEQLPSRSDLESWLSINELLKEHGDLEESINAGKSLMQYFVFKHKYGYQLNQLDIRILEGFAIPAFQRYLEMPKKASLDKAFNLSRNPGNTERKSLDQQIAIAAFAEKQRRNDVPSGEAKQLTAARFDTSVKTVEAEKAYVARIGLETWLKSLSHDELEELIPSRRQST